MLFLRAYVYLGSGPVIGTAYMCLVISAIRVILSQGLVEPGWSFGVRLALRSPEFDPNNLLLINYSGWRGG